MLLPNLLLDLLEVWGRRDLLPPFRKVQNLHFLPNGLDDDWPCSGRVMTLGIERPMAMGTKPTLVNERRVWIVDQHKERG